MSLAIPYQNSLVSHDSTSSSVPARTLSFAEVLHYGFPGPGMDMEMKRWKARNIPNLMRGLWRVLAAKKLGLPFLSGRLCLATIAPDGHRRDYGLVSLRMITSSGAAYVTDAFQGLVALSSMKFHGLGGGATPETTGDTELDNEFFAEYATVNTRSEGIQTEGLAPNYYHTFAFIEVTDTVTFCEHGLFDKAIASGSTLLDRSVIASETIFAGYSVVGDYLLEVATGT